MSSFDDLQKDKPWRSKKYRDGAAGQSCVRCGRHDGTIVPCHYTGIRQHRYGKGKGIKASDITVADLCMSCHKYFDVDIQHKSIDKSEEFHHCVLLTQIRRLRQGILKT